MEKVNVIRFMRVVKDLCNKEEGRNIHPAFRFYDYDNDGFIGSVDIVNLIKYISPDKIE